MARKDSEHQKKSMSRLFRGKAIFKPLNTGWIDDRVACVREWVANIFFYTKNGKTIMIDAGYNYERLREKMRWLDIVVHETERFTDVRVDLDEDEMALLNDKLQYLYVAKGSHPHVSITYFVKDLSKEGGSYETITGTVKNIDSVFFAVIMDDGTLIPIKDIYAIEM